LNLVYNDAKEENMDVKLKIELTIYLLLAGLFPWFVYEKNDHYSRSLSYWTNLKSSIKEIKSVWSN